MKRSILRRVFLSPSNQATLGNTVENIYIYIYGIANVATFYSPRIYMKCYSLPVQCHCQTSRIFVLHTKQKNGQSVKDQIDGYATSLLIPLLKWLTRYAARGPLGRSSTCFFFY